MVNLDDISTLGAKILAEDNPVGHQAYELAEYITLRDEIQKLSRIGQSSSLDWNSVIEKAVFLLSQHSKDLQVACYLAYGLFRQYHFHGLASGLKILADILANYWDKVYPQERERAKIEALNWVALQSTSYLGKIQLVVGEEKFQESIANSLDVIEQVLRSHDLENIYFSALKNKLEFLDWNASFAVEQAEKINPEQHTQVPSEATQESRVNIEQSLIVLAKSARELMLDNPVNPQAYYLNRIAAWGGIAEIPIYQDNVTLLKPVEYFNQQRIKAILETGTPLEILIIAEEIIPQEPLWLDLHFISLEALRKLDTPSLVAQRVITGELLSICRRFPSLEHMKFSDEMPLLSEQFLGQFHSLEINKKDHIEKNIQNLSAIESRQIAEIKESALESKTINSQLSVTQLELLSKNSITDKVRLYAYMAICESLLHQPQPQRLKPYLSFIVELIEQHQLMTWEPTLTLEALVFVYRAGKALNGPVAKLLMERVFVLITKIDSNIAKDLLL